MSKVLVDRELLENCCDAAKDAHAASLLKELEAILDKPAEAEGLDIIGYMDGDYRRDQPSIYIPHVRIVKSCAKGEALMTVTQHLAALSAVTAERDRLLSDNASLRGSCKALGEENKQLKRENKRHGRTLAALAAKEA